MTVSIRIAGASFESYLTKPILPVRAGLVGEFYFGTKESDNLKNWADPTRPNTGVGAVSYDDWGASHLVLSNGFLTQLPETAEFTVVHVGKTTGDASAQLIGVRSNVTTGITAFMSATPAPLATVYSRDNSGSANFVTENESSRPFTLDSITAGRSQGAVGTVDTIWIDRWVAGIREGATQTNLGGTRELDPSGLNWALGYSQTGMPTTGATVTHRAAAIYNRKLSDAELAAVVTFYQGYYAARGITI